MDPELEAYLSKREETLDRVRKMLIESLKVLRDADEIDPDTPLFGTGLGLDSVDAVELVVCVETEFDLELLGDGAVSPACLRSLNTLVDLVLERQGDEPGP